MTFLTYGVSAKPDDVPPTMAMPHCTQQVSHGITLRSIIAHSAAVVLSTALATKEWQFVIGRFASAR